MTTIYSPSDKGFSESLTTIDRAQIALLREVMSQFGGGRMILKGGMAMRAVIGSMRLTKDIDFDRAPSLSLIATKGRLRQSLKTAGASAGIRELAAEITKETPTTVRARLVGRTPSGVQLRFEVEVSGRQQEIDRDYVDTVTVVPPASYGMAPFLVESYNADMLAAMKIAAAMSDHRHAPRDIYDLYDLSRLGANPVPLLEKQDANLLEQIQRNAIAKLEFISFDQATTELFPYLPPAERNQLTEERWVEIVLEVGSAIEGWCGAALKGPPKGCRP
ncbi:nucleotidyl transferase AbiEii/AbiGii toxin family protein [Variovorax sp. LjRoot84]|uniref:nucleotidyl transferase AbiEii/AbiGii toxin family protein n=1 Tax=Variovorax sp. LjRoot84 TaxID=3342340 RepID=UPI003ECDE150